MEHYKLLLKTIVNILDIYKMYTSLLYVNNLPLRTKIISFSLTISILCYCMYVWGDRQNPPRQN